MTVIDLFINSFGKSKVLELLEKESGSLKKIADNWNKNNGFLKKFYKVFFNSSIGKLAQDTLKDKKLKEKDTFEYRRLVKGMKKINCIRPEISALYVFLINNSVIKNMSIPREYFKVLEHSTYKLVPEDKKRKVGDIVDATNKQIQ